jgi:hypothetical protein
VFVALKRNYNKVKIFPGFTVVFSPNEGDNHVHLVVSGLRNMPRGDGIFNSGILLPGQRFWFTFLNPGDYPYFDVFNNDTNGLLTVLPSKFVRSQVRYNFFLIFFYLETCILEAGFSQGFLVTNYVF